MTAGLGLGQRHRYFTVDFGAVHMTIAIALVIGEVVGLFYTGRCHDSRGSCRLDLLRRLWEHLE